jgi:hypothetical protein
LVVNPPFTGEHKIGAVYFFGKATGIEHDANTRPQFGAQESQKPGTQTTGGAGAWLVAYFTADCLLDQLNCLGQVCF